VARRDGLSLLWVCLLAAGFFASGTARLYLVPLDARAGGASDAEVGLLFSVMQVSAAVVSVPAGLLADRFGRRRLLVPAALMGTAGLIVISRTDSYPLALLMQVAGGAGGSIGMAVCMALVIDRAAPGRSGAALGWLTLGNQVGYLAGPALAALLLRWLPIDDDLVVSGCLGLGVVALLPMVGRPSPTRARQRWAVAEVAALLRRRDVGSVFIVMLAATLLWGTVEAYLPLFVRERLELSAAAVGALLALQALLNGAARYPAGRLADRAAGRRPVIVALIAGYGVVLVIATRVPGIGGGLVLTGGVVLIATAFVLLATSFASLSDAANRGTVMGVYTAALFVGLALGPLVFGPVIQSAGYAAGFASCACTATVLSLVGSFVVGRQRVAGAAPAVTEAPEEA